MHPYTHIHMYIHINYVTDKNLVYMVHILLSIVRFELSTIDTSNICATFCCQCIHTCIPMYAYTRYIRA